MNVTDTLRDLGYGETLDVLAEDLKEVVKGVRDTGKAGEVTLKLTVKPNGPAGVAITDKIVTKVPRADRGEALFFLDADANLLRNDPRQHELPLRRIDGGKPDYDPETGEVNE